MISIADIKEKRIPNKLLGILLLCAIGAGMLFDDPSWMERIAGGILVSAFLLLIIWIKPGTLGAGDVKLMAVSGLLLGLKKNLAAFVFAVLLAGIYCLVSIVGKKIEKTSVIAFGPFLCAGIELSMFLGDKFVQWYIR